MRKIIVSLSLLWCVYGCWRGRQGVEELDRFPEIYPDYQEVVIPVNIAPLNFGVAGAEKIEVEFQKGEKTVLKCCGKGKIDIPLKKWHVLLEENKGSDFRVKVFAYKDDGWKGYKPFGMTVVADSIDSYLAYRLIEPGYELGKRLGLFQRDLSSFEEKAFMPPALIENSCVNCHAFCNYSPDRFMFHVRWDHSGTVIVEDEKIKKVNTKTDAVISSGAYRMWHPSGRYIAFSNNQTHQAFHAFQEKKIEVYDLASGLMIYDVPNNRVLTDKRFTNTNSWKTFPAWSPDGKYLYFCEAQPKHMPVEYKDLRYGLYRVAFDEITGVLSDSIEEISVPEKGQKSIVFPIVSPDSRYVLYTVAQSGTFPIWHKEADLEMLDLQTGSLVDMNQVNSDCSDSYHAFASSGRWIAFSSRRMDDLYTRVYFTYFDKEGRAHKPFVLPQKDPDYYKLFLKSYNIPEFIKSPITVSPYQLEKVIKGGTQNAL